MAATSIILCAITVIIIQAHVSTRHAASHPSQHSAKDKTFQIDESSPRIGAICVPYILSLVNNGIGIKGDFREYDLGLSRFSNVSDFPSS